MVSEYYELVNNYINQDTVVLLCMVFATMIWLGWLAVKKFNFTWLNNYYVGQMLCIYLALLLLYYFAQG